MDTKISKSQIYERITNILRNLYIFLDEFATIKVLVGETWNSQSFNFPYKTLMLLKLS